MRTVHRDGTPYGFEDLVNAFWNRVATLDELASAIVAGNESQEVRALADAIGNLRSDWYDFEDALRAHEVATHPEEWSEDTQREYAAAVRTSCGRIPEGAR